MVSYHNARKLSSYLNRTKPYPLERTRISYKGGNSKCQVCNNAEEISTFLRAVAGESFEINQFFAVMINGSFIF